VPGQHVLVDFRHNGDEYVAHKITILASAGSTLVTFTAQLLETDGDIWELAGTDPRVLAIKVTPQTQITGAPARNSYVSVTATFEDGLYVAISIAVIPRPLLVTFTGTIAKIEGDEGDKWTITLSDQSSRVVFVTPLTIKSGNVIVGAVVSITAELRDGQYIALVIKTDLPTEPPLQFLNTSGRLTELTSTSLVIVESGLTQRQMVVTAETVFEGDPRVGDTVSVMAQLMPDGTLRAVRVAKIESSPAQLSIVGTVARINEDRWRVGRWTVLLSPHTTMSGDFSVGDRVRVIGERQSDTQYVIAHSIYEE
jgi:hypothetical protein